MTEPRPPSTSAVDFSGEKIQWDISHSLSYGEYLHLAGLLGAQRPLSDQHDEMLFIVMHQVAELWMKLALHELGAALGHLRRDDPGAACMVLDRVARIQQQMLSSWDVLATISPLQFAAFRGALGQSSGFQSCQYRQLEFLLGNRHAAILDVFGSDAPSHRVLAEALHAPGLYDETLRLLARRGFALPDAVLQRDFSMPYVADEAVAAAWRSVYADNARHRDLYQLAEHLLDLDHHFQSWRYAHLKLVDRVIGTQQGTGGSSGVSYLSRTLELKFFPELWAIRTTFQQDRS